MIARPGPCVKVCNACPPVVSRLLVLTLAQPGLVPVLLLLGALLSRGRESSTTSMRRRCRWVPRIVLSTLSTTRGLPAAQRHGGDPSDARRTTAWSEGGGPVVGRRAVRLVSLQDRFRPEMR